MGSFTKGIFAGAGIVIGLLILIFLALPRLYLFSEDRNFAKLRKKSELDCTTMPLHCLARDEDFNQISLYAEQGRDLELTDNWGQTALFWSMKHDKPDIFSHLLSLKANPNTKDEAGRSIFYLAVIYGKYDIAHELLASGADINLYNRNRYPETALHFCVMKNDSLCVSYLLENGADLTLEDSFGYTVFERVQTHDHIGSEIGDLLKRK